MPYYYITCKFVKDGSLSTKSYAYEVDGNLFYAIIVGNHYKIKNTNGYDYQDSVIELTGGFCFGSKQVVYNNRFLDEEKSRKSEVAPVIPIKKLCQMVEVRKHPYGNFSVKPYGRNIDYPLMYDGALCSSLGAAYDRYVRKNTLITISSKDNNTSISYENYNNNMINEKMGENKSEEKEEKKAMSKIFGNIEFGKYTGNNIKMSINGLAYLSSNDRYVTYDRSKLTLTDVTDFVFDVEGLLYLLPVAIKDIQIGDIIRHNNSYVIVKNKTDNFLEVIEPSNNEVKNIMPLRNIFGFDFYTKVMSLVGENTFGSINENNPFGNMLPFLLMTGNKDTNDFDAKAYMLATVLNGGAMDFQKNPWLMMLMLDDKSDMREFLPLVMFAQNGFNFGEKTCTCNCDRNENNEKS